MKEISIIIVLLELTIYQSKRIDKSPSKSGDVGIAQFTGEDDEVMKNSKRKIIRRIVLP